MAKAGPSSSSPQVPGKKRTRAHVIADASLVDIQHYVVNAGFTGEAIRHDYGYDLIVNTFDRAGLVEPLSLLIQLKAAETLLTYADGESYVFDLNLRDYRLWLRELNPVFLILYEATTRRAYWLYFQKYVGTAGSQKPRSTAKTVRIKVPKSNRARTSFFRHARHLKQRVLASLKGMNLHE